MGSIIAGLTVTVTIIGGTVAYALSLEKRISTLEALLKTDSIKAHLKEALQTLDTQKDEALADIRNSIQHPRPMFGNWEDRDVGRVYQAKTDGFLAAYTSGQGANIWICLETEASEAAIRVRDPRGNCNETGMRTRAGTHDGSVTPVKEGHWYTVRIRGVSRGSVTAYWLPFYS